MKKLLFITALFGTLFFFNACSPGYISSEPTAVVTIRPPRPSSSHIWIGDSWVWRQRQHNYTQQNGRWAKPRRGQNYNEGHWNSTPKGHRWHSGGWRK